MDMLAQAQEKQWYPLKPIAEQVRLVNEQKRFKVIPAGRRSGKTERFKRYLAKYTCNNPSMYFAGAPTFNQAKSIFWQDLKNLTSSFTHSKRTGYLAQNTIKVKASQMLKKDNIRITLEQLRGHRHARHHLGN